MKESFNNDRLMKLIKRLQYTFAATLGMLLISNAYLAYKWQQAAFREVTYFVSPDATYPAVATTDTSLKRRHIWEVENFAAQLTTKVLAHSADTFDNNVEGVLHLMDKESGLRLIKQFLEDDLEALYKQHDGVSVIQVVDVVVDMDRMPFEVLVIYDFQMCFMGLKEQPSHTTRGALFFKATTIPRCKTNPYGLKALSMGFVEVPESRRKQQK